MRPTSTNIATNIPAFLSKLWKMVNDPDTDHLICWSPGGHSFIIQNQAKFWYSLLPIYYKHNNMSSFIRQLNMYGFHKISAENGGMDCDKDEIKFFHPYFQQNQPNLMKHIKRKIASSKASTTTSEDNKVNNVDQITKVLVDVKQLRGRQESVDNQLAEMKQENAALWRELALLRQKHMKQQQIVNKLIQFLVTIVQPSRTGLSGLGVKRRYPLMINDSRYSKVPKNDSVSDGPTIHELDTETALSDTLLNEVAGTDPIKNCDNQIKIDSPASSTNTLIEPENVLLDIPIEDETLQDDTLNSEILLVSDQDLQDGEFITPDNPNVVNLLTDTNINVESNEDFPVTDTDFSVRETDFPSTISDKDILTVAEEYIDINKAAENNIEDSTFDDAQAQQILNPDAMISSIVSPSINTTKSESATKKEPKKNMTVATRNAPDLNTFKVNSVDAFFSNDLDNHLETTQGELDSIKEMLFDGYSLDANALLGTHYNNRFDAVPLQLFNPDEDFPLDLPPLTVPGENNQSKNENYDPMMSGSELTKYVDVNTPFVLDFENLFEDTSDTVVDSNDKALDINNINDDQINTPIVVKKEPIFPTAKHTKSK